MLLTILIVGATYIGIALGFIPRIKSNRATVALMGAGLLLATRQIKFEDLPAFLDFNTLILLFSMMIINANLKICGFFEISGRQLMRFTRSPRAFLALEIVLVGLLSALFLNDTICLMFTPLVLEITIAARRNPIPYLIALATAANIGSVATLTGNPQNMIVGLASGIPYTDFTVSLLPPALLGLGVIWGVLILFYPFEFRSGDFPEISSVQQSYQRYPVIKNLLIVGGLVIAFFVGVPIAEASFLAACLMLFTRRTQPHLVFAEFDWSLLVFFSGLFIVSGSLEKSHISQALFSALNLGKEINLWVFSGITAVLSNLVSNVPAVLLLKPVAAGLSNPRAGWLALAAASTLAGNLTLLGSVANLIVAEIARRWRVDLSFWEYTRASALITLITLALGTLWLQIWIW